MWLSRLHRSHQTIPPVAGLLPYEDAAGRVGSAGQRRRQVRAGQGEGRGEGLGVHHPGCRSPSWPSGRVEVQPCSCARSRAGCPASRTRRRPEPVRPPRCSSSRVGAWTVRYTPTRNSRTSPRGQSVGEVRGVVGGDLAWWGRPAGHGRRPTAGTLPGAPGCAAVPPRPPPEAADQCGWPSSPGLGQSVPPAPARARPGRRWPGSRSRSASQPSRRRPERHARRPERCAARRPLATPRGCTPSTSSACVPSGGTSADRALGCRPHEEPPPRAPDTG